MAIRPTIYVGLGGTGIRAIAQTKKHFEDAYGKDNIPKQIAFAAIDFDLAAASDPTLPTDIASDFLELNLGSNPRTLYEQGCKEGKYQWMFSGNAGFIGDKISDGASQVRTTGRFYTEMISSKIMTFIQGCWNNVKNIEDADANAINSNVDIHIVMSLAGGTGSGSFLNVADLIRSKYSQKARIIGYGVIHGVFRTWDPSSNKTPRVVANAYSAIMDLDYLMNASFENPIEIEINNQKKTLKQPIYDEFFVIDNNTQKGNKVKGIQQLCEVIGNCLFASGGDMGTQIVSGLSNTNWRNGQFNITPKKGWVQALGGCQVVYKGDLLAEIYGYKAAIELIRMTTQEGTDVGQLAQNWTEEARIREDGNTYNMLIDSIVAPEKIEGVELALVDIDNPVAETESKLLEYINQSFPKVGCLDQEVAEKERMLNEKIDQMVRQENGVGNAIVFLRSLKKLCEKYRGEMEGEVVILVNEKNSLATIFKKNFTDYSEYSRKLIKFKSGCQERLDTLKRGAKELLKFNWEIKRREIARDIFIQLSSIIGKTAIRLEELKVALGTLREDYEVELNDKQNLNSSSLTFEYDLSTDERLNMTLEDGEVNLIGLMNTLKKSLLDIDIRNELKPAIDVYVAELPRAKEYKNVIITDIIENLTQEQYDALKFEIATKSSRLLPIDDRGQTSKTRENQCPTDLIIQNCLISLYRPNDVKTRFERDDNFMRNLSKQFLSSTFDSMKQKIIVYRADYAVIPYCIEAFDEQTIKGEYETLLNDSLSAGATTFNPHFDKSIFERMRSTDFKLKPEAQNEALLYWICGHIFGWKDVKETAYIMEKDSNGNTTKIESKEEIEHPKYIRFMGKAYYFWQDKSQSQGKNDKWYPVGGGTATGNRKRAFDDFKALDFPKFKTELADKIKADIQARGIDYYSHIVSNIIKDGKNDYIDRIACTDKHSATYYAQNSADVAQFDAEWDYIEKHLISALKNL